MSGNTRSHETRVEIDAPVEEVWKALTEPAELARWFAPKMSVEPGAGGYVLGDWGPGLAWKTLIEVWEPNRHLRLVETRDRVMSPSQEETRLEPCRLVEDFYLESRGGKTVLRLVHSGFGTSSEWDSEYEGTRGGWAGCFFRMKEGMERHRNESVRNMIVTRVFDGVDGARALELIRKAAPGTLQMALSGDGHFCGTLPDSNGAVLTVSVQPSKTSTVAYVEVLLFGASEAEAAAMERHWSEKLAELFPANARKAPQGT